MFKQLFTHRFFRTSLLMFLALFSFAFVNVDAADARNWHYVEMGQTTNWWNSWDSMSGMPLLSSRGEASNPWANISSAVNAAYEEGDHYVTIYLCVPHSSTGPIIHTLPEPRVNNMMVTIVPYRKASQCSNSLRGKSFDFTSNKYDYIRIKDFSRFGGIESTARNAHVKLKNLSGTIDYNGIQISNASKIDIINNDLKWGLGISTRTALLYLFSLPGGEITVKNNEFSRAAALSSSAVPLQISNEYSSLGASATMNSVVVENNVFEDWYVSLIDSYVDKVVDNTITGDISYTALSLNGGEIDQIDGNTIEISSGTAISLRNPTVGSITNNTLTADTGVYIGEFAGKIADNVIKGNRGITAWGEVLLIDGNEIEVGSSSGIGIQVTNEVATISDNRIVSSGVSSGVGVSVDGRLPDPVKVQVIDGNEFNGLERGIETRWGNLTEDQIVEIDNNTFTSVETGMDIAGFSVRDINNNQFVDSLLGILLRFSKVQMIDSNVFQANEEGVHVAASYVNDITNNRFEDFSKGILVEATAEGTDTAVSTELFEDYLNDTVEGYGFDYIHYDEISNNSFENFEWQDAVAIAVATDGELGYVRNNTYRMVERFAQMFGPFTFREISNNRYLAPSTPHPDGTLVDSALYIEGGSGVVDNNEFSNGTAPAYDTPYQFVDASVSLMNSGVYGQQNGVLVSGEDRVTPDQSVLNLNGNTVVAPKPMVLANDTTENWLHDVRIANNQIDGGGLNICVEMDDMYSTQIVEFEGNQFSGCLTAIDVDDVENLEVNENVFDGHEYGLLTLNSELEEFNGNTAVNVDYALDVDGGYFGVMQGNRVSDADTAVKLDSTLMTEVEAFVHNIFDNNSRAIELRGVRSSSYISFLHNSFYDNSEDVYAAYASGLNAYVANNIFSENVVLDVNDLSAWEILNNLFVITDRDMIVVDDSTSRASYSLEAIEAFPFVNDNNKYDFHGYTYTDPAAGDFSLDGRSFGVDSGLDLLTADLAGVARPSGGASDIGAYEIDLSSDVDSDGDRLYSLIETAWGTDDSVVDTDGDGDSDGDEVILLNQDPSVTDILDSDGDGMNDDYEDEFNTVLDKNDPSDASEDADGDGATNLEEFYYWYRDGGVLDPTVVDSDEDDIWDGWEIEMADSCGISYVDPSVADDTADVDADNLTNLEEYNADTDACTDDTDSDGLLDGNEIDWLTAYADANLWTLQDASGLDPLEDDSDGDGLLDGEEVNTYFSDPTAVDGDSDGLTDYDEVITLAGVYFGSLDPMNEDTDGDGFNDGLEVSTYGTDPTDATDFPADSDLDGLDDIWEDAYTCVDSSVADASDDDDGDGLSHLEEQTEGTDPCDAHSDNDGWDDGYEVNTSGTDPLLDDTDTDSVNDDVDACPLVTAVSGYDVDADGCTDDTDEDGTTDDIDTDDDNDGLLDTEETTAGTDPLDEDTDDDGYLDGADDLPLDSTEWLDTDGDGTGNNADTDDDGDGTLDASDAFPLDASADTDTDGDGDPDTITGTSSTGLVEDTDDDNDGVLDTADTCPLVAYVTGYDVDGDGCTDDTDSDGTTDDIDLNDDNDGYTDAEEAALGTDPLDADTDGDLVDDHLDAFPLDSGEWADSDGDGVGDNTDLCSGTPSGATVDATGCADTDGDGLSDTAEAGYGTDPALTDTDGDGLDDYEEVITYASTGVDATLADTDNDGLNDYEEVITYAATYTCLDPANEHSDADTLDDGDEINSYGTDPCSVDTDGDSLNDDDEVLTHLTDPTLADTDSDGIDDDEELAGTYGEVTDPVDSDSDNDGLSDGEELITYASSGVSANDSDTDDDGLTDYAELVTYASSFDGPLDANNDDTDGDNLLDGDEVNTYFTDPTLVDTDGDGLDDDEELTGTEGAVTDPNVVDSDGDGLTDYEELVTYDSATTGYSTDMNPNSSDTDGDGLDDYDEVITYASGNWTTLGWSGASTSLPSLDPTALDTDGDGVNDFDEVDYGTDPTDASSYSTDDDGDGVVNAIDLCPATPSGLTVDSDGCAQYTLDYDGDGFTDAYEIDEGNDPLDSTDKPDLTIEIVGYNELDGYGSGATPSTVIWNTGVGQSYTGTTTYTFDTDELLYLAPYSTNERVIGISWDETHYIDSPSYDKCGSFASSPDPTTLSTVCTTGISPESSSSGWAAWSALGAYYTFSDWDWLSQRSSTSVHYYLYQADF